VPVRVATADIEPAAGRDREENFPVALRVLPATPRRHLGAIYSVARLVDDAGDDPHRTPAERLELLDALEADLLRIWEGGTPATGAFARLAPTVRACSLERQPFLDLIAANRLDQQVRRYPTYDDLLAYCNLSANPVGVLVLAVAGALTPDNVARSDRVCTALQVLEHCQDVGEDKRLRDRVYLPLEDLRRFGVDEEDLAASQAGAALRALVEFETDRAEALLRGGSSLVDHLHGWARVAVAGYLAGGLATVDALRRAGHDVLSVAARGRKRDMLRHLALAWSARS
jgi:squalene synthase HpnC